jgi:hypothetical protein
VEKVRASSAIRLRLRFSPLDSRVASLVLVWVAALAVAGRRASVRMTMPLPSAEMTNTSLSSAPSQTAGVAGAPSTQPVDQPAAHGEP